MFNVSQLRELIIKPTLLDLISYTDDAMELLVFTCAVESDGGTYLKQIKGPAVGIYQMEPDTYNDLWHNYIFNKPYLISILTSNFNIPSMPSYGHMIYDLRFATAMARIFYKRIEEEIPSCKDVNAIWDYYKKYYNTPKGKATKDESISKYKRFINN